MERVSVLCLLLLLRSLSGAEMQDNEIAEQREASPASANVAERPQPCLSDVHAALREMSAKLGRQDVKIEHLQALNREQDAKLQELHGINQEQDAKLREVDALKQQLQAQVAELKTMKTWANVTENHVESLRRDRAVGQVAFSASLLTYPGSGYTGPFNAHTPLVFRNVISNIGNAYNPNTGYFIAPVRGAYHFEFYIAALGNSHHSGAALVKNGEHVVLAYETEAKSWGQSANAATLLLEVSDVVSLRLWINGRIYENENRHNTFSGRLLFTLG